LFAGLFIRQFFPGTESGVSKELWGRKNRAWALFKKILNDLFVLGSV
jgi:hypothetical protein